MKFIFAVIILAVVATGGLADECETKTKECVDNFLFVMSQNVDAEEDKKVFCKKLASINCLNELKDICHQEADVEKLEEAMKMLSELLEHCNAAGFLRNNFWVLASALIILFSVKKAF